jgi:phosphate transport system permease protein
MDAPKPGDAEAFAPPANLARRKTADRTFVFWGLLATVLGLAVLAALIVDLAVDGRHSLSVDFFTRFPNPDAAKAGILSAWVGSLLVILTTALLAIPVGVMAGLYLEEYAPKNALTDAIELTVNNLAGVPSIVFGLLGLGLFIYTFGMGQWILTAGLTLGLLILPVIIVATREAVRGVPQGIREAAMAVGATKWRATADHVLPYATPGIVTGVIIGLSRALGETAPLIVVGVPTFVAFLPFVSPGAPTQFEVGSFNEFGLPASPGALETVTLPRGGEVTMPGGEVVQVAPGGSIEAPAGAFVDTTVSAGQAAVTWLPFGPDGWLFESFTVMPMQMFNWTQRPEAAFQQNAAAAGIVLLIITLSLNGAAIWLRYRMRKKVRW